VSQGVPLSSLQSAQPTDHPAQPRETADSYDKKYWRVYLLIHLAVVICTVIATLFDTGYWPSSWFSNAGPGGVFIAYLLGFTVIIGVVGLGYVSPLLIVFLFYRVVNGDRHYVAAGLAEVFLAGMHWFAAFPLFQ